MIFNDGHISFGLYVKLSDLKSKKPDLLRCIEDKFFSASVFEKLFLVDDVSAVTDKPIQYEVGSHSRVSKDYDGCYRTENNLITIKENEFLNLNFDKILDENIMRCISYLRGPVEIDQKFYSADFLLDSFKILERNEEIVTNVVFNHDDLNIFLNTNDSKKHFVHIKDNRYMLLSADVWSSHLVPEKTIILFPDPYVAGVLTVKNDKVISIIVQHEVIQAKSNET